MKIRSFYCSLLAAGAMTLAGNLNAQLVTSAGSVLDETAWVTNGYGSQGYLFFNTTNTIPGSIVGGDLSNGDISVTFDSSTITDSSTGTGVAIQNTAGTATDLQVGSMFNTGLGSDAFVNNLTLTLNAGAESSYRVGVLVGARESAAAAPLDIPQSIQITSGSSSASQARITPSSQQADWYFFDVTGLSTSNTIVIASNRIGDIADHRFNPINGVTLTVIPEPSTALLLVGGMALAFMARRRQRQA